MFVVSVVAMMLMKVLGDLAYVVPGLCAFVLLAIQMVDFKEFRENLFAPVILMMAGVIGVADALAKLGLTAFVGNSVADLVGPTVSPLVLVLLFALLTRTASTFKGSNLGSVAIFAPIAIATFLSLGLNPVAVACAVAVAGWNGHYMPIDGMPALIFGMGKSKLTAFCSRSPCTSYGSWPCAWAQSCSSRCSSVGPGAPGRARAGWVSIPRWRTAPPLLSQNQELAKPAPHRWFSV